MPHGEVTLSGPGIYVGLAILAIVLIGAIAMTVDAFRRPRYHFGKFGPWGYIMFFAFYIVLAAAMAVIRFSGFGARFAGPIFLVFLGWTLLLGAIEIIYLLGVVFPDDKDRAKRAEYEEEYGVEVPAKAAKRSTAAGSKRETVDERGDGEYFDDVK